MILGDVPDQKGIEPKQGDHRKRAERVHAEGEIAPFARAHRPSDPKSEDVGQDDADDFRQEKNQAAVGDFFATG